LPRTDLRVFDLTLRFNGPPCALGTDTVTGIAACDAVDRMLFAAGLNGSRTDGLLFVGQK
jgi:hypothetical protein